MSLIKKVINSDGTEFNPPVHPEYVKLREKHPMCSSWGYKCIYCGDCPCGDNFKPVNDEEKLIIEESNKLFSSYLLDHNPDMAEFLTKYKK